MVFLMLLIHVFFCRDNLMSLLTVEGVTALLDAQNIDEKKPEDMASGKSTLLSSFASYFVILISCYSDKLDRCSGKTLSSPSTESIGETTQSILYSHSQGSQ